MRTDSLCRFHLLGEKFFRRNVWWFGFFFLPLHSQTMTEVSVGSKGFVPWCNG